MSSRKKMTMDGNEAAAYASYAYTEVAAMYPITPSSVMPEHVDEWANAGKKNIFGRTVQITEMQSEAGAAGAVHGSLVAGALTSTYTASQGLLLMIPDLYKVAGERLPGVFNVSARCVASHALNIFGDHSDVYACRQTGVAMLCDSSVQEVMDLTPVAYCSAIEGRIPFINFFDGFRTSHEIQKIDAWDYADLDEMVNHEAIDAFKANALNPNHPRQMGSAQNPDIFFQTRETCNTAYDELPDIVQKYMDKVNAKIGTDYKLFNYYGAPDAEVVIVAMGSVNDTIEETIDYLSAQGKKVGVVKVRLYRPFSAKALVAAIPDSVKRIEVLDRTKEPGSFHEPLALDVISALKGTKFESVPVFCGRYGLGSKDTTPNQIVAVFENDKKPEFTIGIFDDVTNLSLDAGADLVTTPEGTTNCKFWGLGADGTVGANKNSIKIIGDNTDMYAQAYFDYDSKKSGGVTMSHLRFGKKPIKSTYLIHKANFVACHKASYMRKFNMVQELVDGGSFLLNCPWTVDELEKELPGQVKKFMYDHKINFYIMNGSKIGVEVGMGPTRINTILQSAFFTITEIIPKDEAIKYMKEAAEKTYGRKGQDVVEKNWAAIDAGADPKNLIKVEIPESWKDAQDEGLDFKKAEGSRKDVIDFVNNIQTKVNAQEGNTLKVSECMPYVDGSTPSGSSAYEKRGIAVNVPVWNPEKCVECGFCSLVCPHAAVRTVALTEEEAAKVPEGIQTKDLTGMAGYKFAVVVSALDCTGCGSCANVCLGNKQAETLKMSPLEESEYEQKFFDYAVELPVKTEVVEKFKETTIKGSQFKKPLLEFSGACAGCGETPYVKLATQLFGDRMYIANATGCTSIWGNSSPSTPYTVNAKGQGPAWDNSLFEDAAEFGYGMTLAQNALRDALKEQVEKIAAEGSAAEKEAAQNWLDTFSVGATNGTASDALVAALGGNTSEAAKYIVKNKDFLAKKSQWIIGGDGWAFDIGFGGLDHVLASGKDINVLVVNTEVYSNTGGQSSKATPIGAVAQFAAGGKQVKQKDLASIAMSYGYVYVAQVAMGANMQQTLKALAEAEAYPGPSLVICYAPCINHGLKIKGGMAKVMDEEKRAVDFGYWNMFRFNPAAEPGKKFTLDSKVDPDFDKYQEFLDGEVRYLSLRKANPANAERLYEQSQINAKEHIAYLAKLNTLYNE